MSAVSWDDPVDVVLRAIGSPDGAPGSGSAATLALSLAVECLALHARLSLRGRPGGDDGAGLERLVERVEEKRSALRVAFEEDARRVEAMIAARRARDAASGSQRREAVVGEIRVIEEANRGLEQLLDLADGVRRDADWLADGRGVVHARSESVTARALAVAARASVEAMLQANVATLARRRSRYAIGDVDLGGQPSTPGSRNAAVVDGLRAPE